MKESMLFQPIKEYFEDLGYSVDGEVNDCDMLMIQGDEVIVVELKNDLNFKLVLQAAKRQKMFENVYVGIWSPKSLGTKIFRDKVYLLNRLGIGLITVSKRGHRVVVYSDPRIHPIEGYQRYNKKKREKTIEEFQKRRSRHNVGGVHQEKLVTAYKEDSLIILGLLYKEGPLKASIIKKKTGIERAYGIVYKNYNGWFSKEGQGVYRITKEGENSFKKYKELIDELNQHIEVENEN